MKFIHAADIHLGSKMDSKFPKEIAAQRRRELRATFKKMIDFALENGVRAVLLSGDVFDSDSPLKNDKDFFYSVISNTPKIDFLYLKGNHDSACGYAEEELSNLKTFSDKWNSYSYEDVRISGIEMTGENAMSFYSMLSLEERDKNIVMLHGQIGDVSGKDCVNLKKLQGKFIDYLALGHIHKPRAGKLDDRGDYAYPGCLEGRGFDETEEHGFYLLETGESIQRTFIPFAERTIREKNADISGVTDTYSAYLKIKEQISFQKRDLYRIHLVGETDLEVEISCEDLKKYLESDCFFADVKDSTVKKLDLKKFRNDLSLKGEFVRTVLENADYSEEDKKKIIALGLKALKGGKEEL